MYPALKHVQQDPLWPSRALQTDLRMATLIRFTVGMNEAFAGKAQAIGRTLVPMTTFIGTGAGSFADLDTNLFSASSAGFTCGVIITLWFDAPLLMANLPIRTIGWGCAGGRVTTTVAAELAVTAVFRPPTSRFANP